MEGLIIAVTFFGGAIGGFSLLTALGGHLQARRMRGARSVSCADALRSTGTIRLTGAAEPPPYPVGPQLGPLSGRPYAWCEARVSYQDSYRDSDGNSRSRTVTVAHQPGAAFVVRDATGAVLVSSPDVDWRDLPYTVNTTSRHLPEALRRAQIDRGSDLLDKVGLSETWADRGARLLFSGDGRTYDLVERLVAPGAGVVVVGDLEPGPDGIPVLGGRVVASTASAQAMTNDVAASVRTSLLVAAIALAFALAAQIARIVT